MSVHAVVLEENNYKVRAVIVDGRAAPLMERRFTTMGIGMIKSEKHSRLYDSVAFHPDMVICPVNAGKMVAEPTVYEYFKKALLPYKVDLLKGEAELSRNYPLNIAYNIATVGKKAFLYSRYSDKIAVDELKKNNTVFINVKQGYTRCSTAVVDDGGIITADRGIYNAALQNGLTHCLLGRDM